LLHYQQHPSDILEEHFVVAMELTPGSTLGHYQILAPLGKGGMGQVYRARDVLLGREVALKVLRDDLAGPDWLARFGREAQLLATLNHPGIVIVHDTGEVAGLRYLVMELVSGQSLAQRLSKGSLPPGEALEVCRQIAEALEAAHERGIVHRDLKPANVMLTAEGKVKVLDFGLARAAVAEVPPMVDLDSTRAHDPSTGEGVIQGTPAYMAPEQARGRTVDRRCDVWAFGCVLYETLTGKQAFAGETFSDVLAAVLERVPSWKALPASVPPRIGELIRRCLQKDHHQRLRDLGDARLEIQEAQREPPVSPPPARRRLGWVLLAAVLMFVVGPALGLAWRLWRSDEKAPAWTGQYLLGGTINVFGPRVSPDGQWLAFLVVEGSQAQVGVMKLGTGEWWALTRDGRGGPLSLCWSADSSRVYFDRWLDVPVGVYSVSPLEVLLGKGQERLDVAGAECPQVLPDGTLVVGKLDDEGNYRLYRHWPDDSRTDQEVSPPLEFARGWPSPVRALHRTGQNKVVFCGKVLGGEANESRQRQFYLLDVETREYRPLYDEPVALDFVQLAVSADDRHVYTLLPREDAYQVVKFPLTGQGPVQTLHTLLSRVWGFDVDRDGKLYLDQFQRRIDLLRLDPDNKVPVQRLAHGGRGWDGSEQGHPVELPDGRVLLANRILGRDSLWAVGPGKEPAPLVAQDRGETTLPAMVLGDRLVCLAGSGAARRLKVFSLQGDPLGSGPPIQGGLGTDLMGLAASPKGDLLYYAQSRRVWEVPTDGSKEPRLVAVADRVAVSPQTGELFLLRFEKTGVRLSRVPLPGAPRDVEIPAGDVRLAPSSFGQGSIHPDTGQLLVTVVSPKSWFWRPAVLTTTADKDGRSQVSLKLIEVDFEGDLYASWSRRGGVLGWGQSYRGELWRLTPGK
jgi:hypothetical protein